MRYADHAYAHACDRPHDPGRGEALDRNAEAAGAASAADYIDAVQGHPETRSFQTEDGRTCWANEGAGLYGWNNSNAPETSTVVPCRDPIGNFEKQKANTAERQGVTIDQIEEKGPISEQDRQAPERGQDAEDRRDGPPPSDPEPEKGGGPQGGAGGAAAPGGPQAAPPERTPIPPPPPPPPPQETESNDLSEERGR